MSIPVILREFAFCFLATLCFAVLFNAPRRTLPVSAAAAGVGWLVFRLMGSTLPAYFAATLCIALLGESAARLLKKPATIFIHAAVVPLVPGGGLYATMLYLVSGEFAQGLHEGARTLLAMGMIAMAIGLASLLFKYLRREKRGTMDKVNP